MKTKTSSELKEELHNYVLQTADELMKELRERRKLGKIVNKSNELCIK
jgi:hypothetical protein